MLERRALEIWEIVQAYTTPYDWAVGPKARKSLNDILGETASSWGDGDAAATNRQLRELLTGALNDPNTDYVTAGRLYGWIVADWGGVRRNRQAVEAWSQPANGWHGDYGDDVLLAFADRVGATRISSWSKVFAFAAPDRHAIYDSRVAVALNLALEQLGEVERFVMPPSRIVRDKDGVPRPNAVARARARLSGGERLGYREYLAWLGAVRAQSRGVDFLTIEASLFANAPRMALGLSAPDFSD